MRLLAFPRKLRLTPLWPALAAVITATTLLWYLLPGLFQRGASVQLLDTLRILAPIVAERAGKGEELQGWVRAIGADSGLRITVVASDGWVVADSAQGDLRRMENHAGRPEIREALARGEGVAVRRSGTTGQVYVYAARAVNAPGGRLLVLRLAEPLSELQALRGRLAVAMALAAAAAGVAILLISLWIDRRLFEPLARLIAQSSALVSGRVRRVEVPAEEDLAPLGLALNRLAETAEAQFAAVRDERDHLKAILASMSEGVLVVGADGRALLLNPAFHRLFDLPGDDVAGKPVLEIIRQPELARIVDDTLRQGESQSGQIELHRPDRRTLLLASAVLSGSERGGERGPVRGAVVVARDTTDLTRVADMRRDFVANVSHELKTPLAAIRGYAETLRDGALDEPGTARRFTDRILSQCRRLQLLLDDLLTLSRLESVAASPEEREPIDLQATIRRAAELLSGSARERQVRLEVRLDERVPPVLGDPDGIERLVVNLIDNAIKYNRPDGGVAVRLARHGAHALLEVCDTGIGIPQDALTRIFERFYRVDKGRGREEGGTGLGLAIVMHVSQAHGGQVEVESRIGKGTTFRVRLPLG